MPFGHVRLIKTKRSGCCDDDTFIQVICFTPVAVHLPGTPWSKNLAQGQDGGDGGAQRS